MPSSHASFGDSDQVFSLSIYQPVSKCYFAGGIVYRGLSLSVETDRTVKFNVGDLYSGGASELLFSGGECVILA